ncbi:hypothetical protein EYF80_034408 [Liparis tanakae]|uniref:Uncharacterized protein n=1 Tax=Liparis tanakae TaxID=230148 RepID=A0A4Z2GPJ8_9TELE|nr:hypothetical protein EYF80_034408 [Liparis tanakae]
MYDTGWAEIGKVRVLQGLFCRDPLDRRDRVGRLRYLRFSSKRSAVDALGQVSPHGIGALGL